MRRKFNRTDAMSSSRGFWSHRCSGTHRRDRSARLGIESLEPRLVLGADSLLISEFLAVNANGIVDENGDHSDWIEISNPTTTAVNLNGWSLTDNSSDLTKWRFPAVTLQPGDELVVFASGKDRTNPAAPLHTNFRLGSVGEYLALVKPDGVSVAHAYSPYPAQREDISYGIVQDVVPFVKEGDNVVYRVPTSADGSLGTDWTAVDFDASTWFGGGASSPIVITEAGTGSTDYVEIQNVTRTSVATTGWIVAVNDALSGSINNTVQTVWSLPASMTADQVLYRTDSTTDNYYGADIPWLTSGPGWVMVLTPQGEVADFVVWGYTPDKIASLDTTVSGFHITAADLSWGGEAVPSGGTLSKTLQRSGSLDHDLAGDWGFISPSTKGTKNTVITTPFPVAPTTGLGYSLNASGFNVTYYKSKVAVTSIAVAESVISDPTKQATKASETTATINYINASADAHYGSSRAFPSLTTGTNMDDFVTESTATIVIPTAGPWTFGVNSDEGFSLALTNGIDTFSSSFAGLRGPSDTFATFNITQPGAYNLRLVHFDRTAGASLELFAASGTYSTYSSAFRLIGDSGGLSTAGFGEAIRTDTKAQMYNINSSLWTRSTFNVMDVTKFDSLTLRVKYNDGFVAYLNGQEIARRNAPDVLQWNSTATGARTPQASVLFEEINITQFLNALRVGKNVLAVHALNVSAGDNDFLLSPELVGVGIVPLKEYFPVPTPGKANGTGFLDFVGDTKFSVDHGFYTQSFQLVVSSETPGATIRYTTDGSTPSETKGEIYTGPLTISSTTVLRAMAYKAGYQSTDVDTQTYLFLSDVIRQSANGSAPTGWPAGSVNGQVLDYGMDPDIVNSATWGPQVIDALKAIPTMSIVTDVPNLFNASKGIYVNATQDGIDWERPASVELINPDGTKGFNVHAGLRIRGGYSRDGSNPKHAWRLFFRKEYGDSKLVYPLFGSEGTDTFDKIDFRCSQNYSWSFGGDPNNAVIRDVFARDSQGASGQAYTRSRPYHVYINGQYWGLYETEERPEASFGATYFGGNRQDYDVIKVTDGYNIYATDGTLDAWQNLWNQARAGLGSDAAYYRVQGLNPDGTRNPSYPVLVDVDNVIDYVLNIFYTGNKDAPISWFLGEGSPNNFYAIRNRTGEEGFRFFVHDAEHTLLMSGVSRIGPFPAGDTFEKSNPQWLHQQLMYHPDYRMRFADHVQKQFFNGGIWTAESASARFRARAKEIEMAIIAESARWGDSKTATPLTKINWQNAVNNELNNFIPTRAQTIVTQLKTTVLRNGQTAPLYPSVAPPTFGKRGGQVLPGYRLTLTAGAGTIYYTLDGSDPRLPGGAISSKALVYQGPIALSESVVVRTRALSGGTWSAIDESQFVVGVPAAASNLVVTEINYNPLGPMTGAEAGFTADQFEYVELKNVGSQAIDLTDVRFSAGVNFNFTGSRITELEPGAYVLVVGNEAAFEARYGTLVASRVAGAFSSGKLDNNGERLALIDYLARPIFDFAYSDSGVWPTRADGDGFSLELMDPGAVPALEPQRTDYLQNGNHWRSTVEFGGTPSYQGIPSIKSVVVNEVLANSDAPLSDTIELYNPTTTAVDVGGWFLSDTSAKYWKFTIPADTIIQPGGYLVFDESDFNPTPTVPGSGFALSSAGDDVWLMKPGSSGRVYHVDRVQFGATRTNESLGRWPNGTGSLYPMISRTFDPAQGQNSGPRVGPLIISEINYQPQSATPDDVEFVEIYNPTSQAVDLTGWRLGEGVSFDFPAGTPLASHAALVVVSFDPQLDPVRLSAFRSFYSIGASIRIVGPYSGRLSDSGEKVSLERPTVPTDSTAPRTLEDELDYLSSWYATTAGGGQTLNRLGSRLWGHDKTSFRAQSPTPGTVDLAAQIEGRYVFYNGSAFDGNDAGANAMDDGAIAEDKAPLLPGQTATFANYTSYSRGINGIMIDLFDLKDPALLGASDFVFRVGNNNDTATWTTGPNPSLITVRPGEGAGGSDRVTLIWPDDAVESTWLQVNVLATAHTGLAAGDVFYFGNAIGETGDSANHAQVDGDDVSATRNHQRTFLNPAPIDFAFDFNRDARVNALDMLLARNNQTTSSTALALISPPGAPGVAAQLVATRDDLAAVRAAKERATEGSLPARPFWWYELEQPGTVQPLAKQNRLRSVAVDELFSVDWP